MPMADDVTLLRSDTGYTVASQSRPEGDLLTVVAPDGRLCLRIELLPEGPVLEVRGQALRLASAGELRLDCERLTINATRATSIRTGELHEVVEGDARLEVGGVIDTEGHSQRLRARRGDVELAANDDVVIDGERVRLNSPKVQDPAWTAMIPARK
jgi:phage gp45-like